MTFDLRNAGESDAQTNLRLRWNNQFAGSFLGTSQWQRYGVVLGSDDGYSTVVWRETVANTGAGPEVDNIRLFRIDSRPTDFELDLNGSLPGTGHALDYLENSQVGITTNDLALRFANGNILSSAIVRIHNFDGTQRLLVTTIASRMTAEFNSANGILRLLGRDTIGNYQRLLRSLEFTDSSDNPPAGLRRISISTTDGTASSNRQEVELDVIPVNDTPRVTAIPDFPLTQNSPLTVNAGAIDPDDTNLTFNLSIDGDVEIFGSSLPTISNIGQIQLTAVTHGSADIAVSVKDPDGLGSEFTFSVTTPFAMPAGSIPANFVPFSGQLQLSGTLPALRDGIYNSAPVMTIDMSLNYQAVIETAGGEIRFELFAAESPIAVNNFVDLAEYGFYDGLTFHRVIDNFVAQAGDPMGSGSGGPGYQFSDELSNGLTFERFGQLAMDNSGPKTNGSQFFFTLNDNPVFAGQQTIFGQVVSGEDVLRAVNLTSGTSTPQIIQRIRIDVV